MVSVDWSPGVLWARSAAGSRGRKLLGDAELLSRAPRVPAGGSLLDVKFCLRAERRGSGVNVQEERGPREVHHCGTRRADILAGWWAPLPTVSKWVFICLAHSDPALSWTQITPSPGFPSYGS